MACISKNAVIKLMSLLMIFVVLGLGCAMYRGPAPGSTAYPPQPPPKPEPLKPIVYEHTVKTQESMSNETVFLNREMLERAYAKRGRPLLTCAFYTSENTIILGRSTAPLYHGHGKLSISKKDSKGNQLEHLQAEGSSAVAITTGAPPAREQLVSWSDLQQAVFSTLRSYGLRVSDPEITTLQKVDHLVARMEQDVSIQTAELESLQKACDGQVLYLVQEIDEKDGTYLQGRMWDLQRNELIAASRVPLYKLGVTWLDKETAIKKAQKLTENILSQVCEAWNSR